MGEDLFYLASKLMRFALYVELWPHILGALGVMALLLRWRRAALWFWLLSLGFVGFVMAAPVDRWIAGPLEARFMANPDLTGAHGVLLMTGAENTDRTARTGLVNTGEAADRILATIALAHALPNVPVIVAGGQGRLDLQGHSLSEAEVSARAIREAGIADERLTLESQSRNSAESAVNVAAIAREITPDLANQNWIIVTSAMHMPRAISSFCAAGWRSLIPYPVDHSPMADQWFSGEYRDKVAVMRRALHERVGALVYRFTGRAVSEDQTFALGCVLTR